MTGKPDEKLATGYPATVLSVAFGFDELGAVEAFAEFVVGELIGDGGQFVTRGSRAGLKPGIRKASGLRRAAAS